MKKLTTEEFIERSIATHGEGKYKYDKCVYKNRRTLVTLYCCTCNEYFEAHIGTYKPLGIHTSHTGCPKCAKATVGVKHRSNTADFIAKAEKIHSNKYTYEKVEYTTSKDKVTITCSIHGYFEQDAKGHLQGHGCPSCSKRGFKVTKPGILYYLSVLGGTAYKIGITNYSVEKRFNKDDMDIIKIIKVWKFANGQECYDKEQEIIKEYSEYLYSGDNLLKNGNSELFSKDILLLDSDGTLTPTPTGNLSDRHRVLSAVEL